MHGARTVAIPIDHLIAEVAAFPLASEDAFEIGASVLDGTMSTRDAKTLWRAAEGALLGAFPAFSVEELVAARDRLWFPVELGEAVPLDRYLRELSHLFLRASDGVLRPWLRTERGDSDALKKSAGRARQAWRWLTFALPGDLLAASWSLTDDAPWQVDVLAPVLARCLQDAGYAESHLHFGAAFDFSSFWIVALRAIANPAVCRESLQSPGGVFDDGLLIVPWLLRAATVRYCLAAFLRDRRTGTSTDLLGSWLERRLLPLASGTLGALATRRLLACIDDVGRGRLRASLDDTSMRSLYRELTGIGYRPPPQTLAQVPVDDPVAALLPSPFEVGPPPEISLVRASLRHLADDPGDRLFASLFWQTMRLRNLVYRHVTQRPLTPGLQWFVRTFGRLKGLRHPLSTRMLLEGALEVGGHGRGLRSLEARTAPSERVNENLGLARAALAVVRNAAGANAAARRNTRRTAYAASGEIELGLVLHFTKSRGDSALRGMPAAHWESSEAAPGRAASRPVTGQTFRYEHFYQRKKREAQALSWVLLHFPSTLAILRGIDVCTDELGVPTWVFTPLLRYLRDVGDAAACHLSAIAARPRRSVANHGQPSAPRLGLGVTVHAGEDFVHLLGGLRRVDEAVRSFDLREGDRIGHAVALGVDVRRWSDSAGRLPVMREERLLDLVWEWQWYARGHCRGAPDRLAVIEQETLRITKSMFGRPCTPAHMADVFECLHSERDLRRLGFPTGLRRAVASSAGDDPLATLAIYLTSTRVFREGRAIDWIDPASEAATLEAIQSTLRREIGSRGLTIEVNPTSNLLIANLADLTSHPLWRLRPPRGNGDAPPVAICIGSDDPVTFATNLREEFALLHDALLAAGLSDDEAQRWLSDVRQRGLDARFTVPTDATVSAAGFTPVYGLGTEIIQPP